MIEKFRFPFELDKISDEFSIYENCKISIKDLDKNLND